MSQSGRLRVTPGVLPPSVPLLFTEDSGTATPVANNINIVGQKAGTIPVVDTIGSGSTVDIENRSWTTSFIVDPSATVGLRGTFQTITAALAAASSGQTIFIRPGTYVENITMKAGISLQGYEASAFSKQTVIQGTISCSYSGFASISGIELYNIAADIISITGAAQTILTVTNCNIIQDAVAGSQYAFNCSNAAAQLKVSNCNGNLNTNGAFFNISAGTLISFDDCNFRNDGSSTIPNVISGAPTVFLNNCWVQNLTSMTGGILQTYCSKLGREDITQTVLALVASRLRAYYTDFSTTGGATAITIDATSTAEMVQCSITDDAAANLITNAGTLTYDIITQRDPAAGTGQGSIPTPTTSTLSHYGTCKFTQGQIVAIKTPVAYPYTTIESDYVILVDTSVARTINLIASPKTGQTYRIKDNVGSAAANNITVTPAAGNIDGAASFVMNANYQAVDLVYNGTQWNKF